MRFCHVTTFYPPYHFGGDAILVQSICEALVRRGHEVDVVHCQDSFKIKGGRVAEPRAIASKVRRYGLQSRFGALSPLLTQQTGRPVLKKSELRKILRNDYDVVNFHNISLIGGPAVLAMSRAPVTLYTTHEHWLVCPAHVLWKNRNRPCDGPQCVRCCLISGIPPQLWRYTNLTPRSLENVDAILAPSRFTAEKHREAGISRPIRVMNPFVTVDSDPVESVDRPSTPTFAYVGRLIRSKGIEQVLEALAQRPSYRLLVAGDGPLGHRLREQYRGHSNIRFLGAVPHDQVNALYRKISALVVPSIGPEVFPMSVLESLSNGTPVIVRRTGGSAESVEQTGGGLVYSDSEELLPLLDRLANEERLRRSLGEKARRGVEAHFTEERWFSEYLGLVESISESNFPENERQLA
jgi:glycosyltransferase involved in cell wall biosynthesis